MSGEDCSVSSRMSNKSEKNMADFDGEDSVCDEELMQLAAHAQVRSIPLVENTSGLENEKNLSLDLMIRRC